ncbi:MAG: endonuclease I family protein [Mangrovibacterium sp.]
MKLKNTNILSVLFLALLLGTYACTDDSNTIPLPPDYVDPNGETDGDGDGNGNGDGEATTYHYITPSVDSKGDILVLGTPKNYSDTAKYHVLAVASIDLEDYYASAVGKKGNQLRAALAAIVKNNFVPVTYGEARSILVDADRHPLDETKIWCSYEEHLVNASWDQGATWNREHVWAKSKGLGGAISNNEAGPASDIYNLKAEELSVNTRKSNRDFAEKDGDESYYGIHGTAAYAPMESGRGDVARIMFYMQLRWNGECGIVLDNEIYTTSTEARHGVLTDLIKWHSDDPVDPFEIRRSNIVYSNQKNRNPFVDHPELVDYLFGDMQNQAWDGGVTYKNN